MNNRMNQGNWFLDQLALYQTANSDYQSVKDNFIIRTLEYEIIIDAIISKCIKDPLQHELILGRRGSGKSTLLKRIEIEIIENPIINKNFIAINFAEEQAGIYRLFDLWEQVIAELKMQYHYEIKIQNYKDFKKDQEYTRYLYELIHNYCKENKKRIVLLLDNFDRIVENFTDDGNLLRETLINYADIQIIAGSTRMNEHFWRYDMPFYNFFRTHKLETLSRNEIDTLLNHWGELLNIDFLKNFVAKNPEKIENIRILTDGLPRTIQFFIQIILQDSNTNIYDYLKKIMDNVSPLYQERLNTLTPQLRKIVYEMAFIWEACTTKQLVEQTKMESKLISANLKTLIDKGIVDKIETSKKQHLYRISERFFNIWIIITQGNLEQNKKTKWLSIFLDNWYQKIYKIEKKEKLKSNNENILMVKESKVLYSKNKNYYHLENEKKIIIDDILNGKFKNIENDTLEIINSNEDTIIKNLLFDLLIHQQENLVMGLFKNEKYGEDLKNKFIILYYVTLILNNVFEDNLLLKIPPEIKETINEVLEQINEKEKFYGYK